jgi:hypothetical protein
MILLYRYELIQDHNRYYNIEIGKEYKSGKDWFLNKSSEAGCFF